MGRKLYINPFSHYDTLLNSPEIWETTIKSFAEYLFKGVFKTKSISKIGFFCEYG